MIELQGIIRPAEATSRRGGQSRGAEPSMPRWLLVRRNGRRHHLARGL